MIHHGGNLGIRIDFHEAAAELIAFTDIDQPGVILSPGMAKSQQFLQHYRDLDAIGRGQGVKLQWVLAHRQFFVMGGAGDGPVDVGELTAVAGLPLPDFRRCIGVVGHWNALTISQGQLTCSMPT